MGQVIVFLIIPREQIFKLYRGKNKLHFDEMMMPAFDFYCANSLTQWSAGRNVFFTYYYDIFMIYLVTH
jgi:hypothetical protein